MCAVLGEILFIIQAELVNINWCIQRVSHCLKKKYHRRVVQTIEWYVSCIKYGVSFMMRTFRSLHFYAEKNTLLCCFPDCLTDCLVLGASLSDKRYDYISVMVEFFSCYD